ncbi:lantibiotic dehydratase [Actinomadura mexicana]|uniref:Lantibiotic dehydratase, C terminus n=1 Tax=Actinomadura mexicana TaxID=134959 RepID=A0A239HRD4_9ACTN|nr:lantibiotic dehydratase [Actinomadura mexicana]SNS83840.1 Lantibiotic dehydratase, C terminus [Actinomadura mexicana]
MPIADEFAVRVAGLPADVLHSLRAERSWAVVQEILDCQTRLAAEGAALSDALYEVIADAASLGHKPLLVALRRAVFTGRRPRARELSGDIRVVLPERIDERILAWLDLVDRRDALRDRLPLLLDEETRDARSRLLIAASDPAFHAGLEQAAPGLAADLDTWLRSGPDAVPGRKALGRIARYVARTAGKTSPFATFAVSGMGAWADCGVPVHVGDRPLRGMRVVELHRGAIDAVWRHLADRPGLRDRGQIRVNPSAFEDDGRIVFLGTGRSEPIRSIANTPAVCGALAAVRSRPGATRGDLARVVDPMVLEALLEHGLLERRRPYADQSADPLADLIAWLPEGLPETGELARLRVTVKGEGQSGEQGEVARRTARIRALVRKLTPAGTEPPGKALALEATVQAGTVAHCDPGAWAPAVEGLQAVRLLLGVLDPDLPVKRAAAIAFSGLFGPGVQAPLLTFYRRVHDGGGRDPEGLRTLLRPPPGGFTGAPPPALAEARRFRSDLWRTLYTTPEAAPGVIHLDPVTVHKIAASWPAHVRAPHSICCHVQALTGEETLRLVLNAVSSGHGRGTGRLRRLLAEAGAEPPPSPEPAAGVAECRGAFGHVLSLRSSCARPISYPGVFDTAGTSDASQDAVAIADLTARHDPARGLLTLHDPDGRELRPAHLGSLAPALLPPALSFLLRVFGEPAQPMPPSWQPCGDDPAARGLGRWPRLDVGAVTLRRSHHRIPADRLPAPAKGEREAEHLVRFSGWLRDHAIPSAFFARVIPRDPVERSLGKSTKPLYIDAASPHLLRDFFRAVDDPSATVLLEEALPAPGDNPRYGADGVRVTEFAVQIDADDGEREGL